VGNLPQKKAFKGKLLKAFGKTLRTLGNFIGTL
jgi:hypothetical protein